MIYFLFGTIVLAYLIFKFLIVPLRLKAAYVRMFRDNGYKVYQYPLTLQAPSFQIDLINCAKDKGDCSYNGKHIFSDSYDVLIGNTFNAPQLIFLSQKLIKAFHDKDIQMKAPKITSGFKIFRYVLQKGLIFIEKNVWKHRRRILSKVFNFDFIGSQIPVMVQSADVMFEKFEEEYWSQHPEDRKDRKIKLTLYKLIGKYASSIIMAGFLGMDSMKQQLKGKTIQEEVLKLTDESIRLSTDPLNLLFGQKFLKLGLRKADRDFIAFTKEVNQILLSYIKKQREQRKSKQQNNNRKIKTIIQLVLQQIQKQGEDGQAITDDDLVDDIKTFILAGTDTTANFLTMLLLYIYEHPQVLERLRNQISLYIKSDQDITLDNIKKLKYTDYVIFEGGRMFGAAEDGFQRSLQQDAQICGIPLKKGTCLNFYYRPLFSNPSLFKDPLSFKPERWQADSEENKQLIQLISLQFYGGPRSCIGKHLALTQAKVGLIKFLRRYQNLVEPKRNNRIIERTVVFHIATSEVQLQKYQ